MVRTSNSVGKKYILEYVMQFKIKATTRWQSVLTLTAFGHIL